MCSVVGWGTMLQAGRSWIQFSMRSLDFSNDLILPVHYNMDLGSTQPLTEMSTRNLPGVKSGWQPHSHLWANCLENVEDLTSQYPMVEHTNWCSQFVTVSTRRLLVTNPTMAILLLRCSNPLWTVAPFQLPITTDSVPQVTSSQAGTHFTPTS
jgi:hypothetical protein